MSDPAQTAEANNARRRATQAKLQRVEETLKRMRCERNLITYPAVARRAGVSRTFLYSNGPARQLMAAAVTISTAHQYRGKAEPDATAEASWRERALNAENSLKAAHAEILAQRNRIGQLLGHIRDLDSDQPADSMHRMTTENAALKERVRELTADNRSLQERLQAARANVRFADRKIAQLEAQLADTARSG